MSPRGKGRAAAVGLSIVLGACGDVTGAARPTEPVAAITPRSPSIVALPLSTIGVADDVPAAPAVRLAPPPTEPVSFTAAFTGDILVHSPLWKQAARNAGGVGLDFRPMLAPLEPMLDSVDLAVCHLETPIAPSGEAPSTEPRYGVPVEVADAIAAAGYDRCSTASNHTADRGAAGIDRTVAALEAVGVGQSGMARTPAEIEPHVFDVHGVRVSHLAYTFSFNGLSLPPGEEWRSAVTDPVRIVADATDARRRGAQVVIVSLHWGAEASSVITVEQRRVAEAVTASGQVDLIVGHHAHVLQPIEQINGVWVVFGLGNVLSNHPAGPSWPASSQDAAVVETRLTVGSNGHVVVDRPVVRPTWVDKGNGWVVHPVLSDLADPNTPPWLRTQLETSLRRTRQIVGDFVPPA